MITAIILHLVLLIHVQKVQWQVLRKPRFILRLCTALRSVESYTDVEIGFHSLRQLMDVSTRTSQP